MADPHLQPCPFCGGTDLIYDGINVAAYITCESCGAFGPEVKIEGGDGFSDKHRGQATERWNRREYRMADFIKPLEIMADGSIR
jgi:Lar family restriction alleviation protein